MKSEKGGPIKIFTWHIHGTYLYYLSRGNYTIYIPVLPGKQEGYYGLGATFPFGDNVIEIPAGEVREHRFDCILFQSQKNWTTDQNEILSDEQRKLPRVYVTHDPPWHSPCDEMHVVDDPDVIMVHVSHFNKLMWHNRSKVIKVIEHGVIDPKTNYTGELNKGIVVVNHLHQRGRKLGADIFEKVSRRIPLDLIGMGTEEYGGLGEVLHTELPGFIRKYRFFFNPIRYTSLGLAVIEAMMVGLPVVALATTEYVTLIRDGETGYINTDINDLICKMEMLLGNKTTALEVGAAGKDYALKRFNLHRFIHEWEATFELAINKNNEYEKNRLYQ